jgi:hypothetical protein
MRFVLDGIGIGLQVLDVRLQAAVLELDLFQLLREYAIFAALGAISDDAIRAEQSVVAKQNGNHHGEDGGDAAALSIRGSSDGEASRQPAGLRLCRFDCSIHAS